MSEHGTPSRKVRATGTPQPAFDFDAGSPPEGGHVEETADARARRLAVDPLRNVALEASAGTGKTRVLVDRYVRESRDAVFYQDPHLCLRCHYRSTELLWQCPHCHEWNSFVEERLTPARDRETSEIEPVA